jgi:D-arabinose 1-dehydrogenase-like Zn-dependent alcohol dehydrogenase
LYDILLVSLPRTDILDIGIESYIHKIPDNMLSEHAAPLQCAGSTVYSALISSAKPGDRVGIIGIGGLGHLAIQFSAKMGYETVVLSTSADKEAEARSFGASEFYLLSEAEKITKPINVLIVTGSRYPDWAK